MGYDHKNKFEGILKGENKENKQKNNTSTNVVILKCV